MTKIRKQRIFIGSSSEALHVAQVLQVLLAEKHFVEVWNQSAVPAGTYPLVALLERARNVDFGIFIFSGNDFGIVRGMPYNIVRDNVLVEAGIFMGSLGKDGVLLLTPNNSTTATKIPSDFDGLNTIKYPDNSNRPGTISDFAPSAFLINERIFGVLKARENEREVQERASCARMFASLSENQKRILRAIHELVICDIRKIGVKVGKFPLSELFYRIEKLRILGMVHNDNRRYHVKEAYRNFFDDQDTDKTHPDPSYSATHIQGTFVSYYELDPSIQTEFSPPDFEMISLAPPPDRTGGN